MFDQAECHGGPHDGALMPIPVFEFTWIDGKRNYRNPAPGRRLYLKKRTIWHGFVLEFVEYAYVRCARCEVYASRRTPDCTLCGASL